MSETKITTAECIAWLNSTKEYLSTKTSQGMAMGTDDYDAIESIRAKLLAASEMAKALEWHEGEGDPVAEKVLTKWRAAGGE